MTQNMLPLVIFDGNCQGQHLAAILTAANLADCYFVGGDLGFLPSHLGVACKYTDEAGVSGLIENARIAGRHIIQGTQSTPMSDATIKSYTPLVDQVIRYTHLQNYAIAMDEARSKFGANVTPARMLRMDYSIVEACQKRAHSSVDFVGYMKEHGPQKPLFHTALHPGGDLVALLFRSFASQLPNVDAVEIEATEAFLRRSEGINSISVHPVNESVLTELGFNWGDIYEIYRDMLNLRVKGNWNRIIELEADLSEFFSRESQYWLCLSQAYGSTDNYSKAEICAYKLLEMSPGFLHFWLVAMQIYIKSNDIDGLNALAHKANGFFRGQRIYHQFMAYMYLNTGRATEAEPHARQYYAHTPDRADALVPLLKMLIALNKLDEAKTVLRYELSHQSEQRISEIRANFISSPEVFAALDIA